MNNIENYLKLSIKELKKYWYLDNNQNWLYSWIDKEWKTILELNFKTTKQENSIILKIKNLKTGKTQYIQLFSTPCNFWWVRWWFVSPKTNKKASILYLNSTGFFESRETLKLFYPKQIEPKIHREYRKIIWENPDLILDLKNSIKYPYRNWKVTRKQKKLLKLTNSYFDIDGYKQLLYS